MTSKQQFLRLLVLALGLILWSTIVLAHGDQQHLMGTVTKFDAASMSVKTTTGEEKVVMILSTTKFVKGTAPATAHDLRVGDRVVIHAKPAGNMLDATEVKIGETKNSMHRE
jgi:Domain of unknown function (DUF5666)